MAPLPVEVLVKICETVVARRVWNASSCSGASVGSIEYVRSTASLAEFASPAAATCACVERTPLASRE
jgi:hypothetical protein